MDLLTTADAQQKAATEEGLDPAPSVRSPGRLAAVFVAVGLIVSGVVAFLPWVSTPAPVAADADAEAFSAERAMQDLEAVVAGPRPMGSPAHAAAIETIQSRLADLGVASEVVEDVVARPDFGQVFAARVRNVVARIPGSDSTGAVLLLSHFDSVPTSPNASDGGLGVATLLETVRAVQEGPPLRNDLVLWFGDADETTAMNVLALERHRWFQDVRFAYAFEAIGVDGPSILTYAGEGDPDPDDPVQAVGENEAFNLASNPHVTVANGRWLEEALAVVPHPVVGLPLADSAMSVGADLGMVLSGNDAAGVSFTQVGDSSGYHTDRDNPARVSLSSLQDSGETSLALARHFGDMDFTRVSAVSGRVAFSVLPGVVVAYPSTVALPLALLVVAGLAAGLMVGRRRGLVTLTGVLVGIGATLASVVVAMVTAVGLAVALTPNGMFARGTYGDGWWMLALGAVVLASVSAVFLGVGRLRRARPHASGIVAGPLVVLGLLALLTAAAMPSMSYVFAWPALAGTLWFSIPLVRGGDAPSVRSSVVALVAVGATVAVIAVPLTYLLAAPLAARNPMMAGLIALFGALLAGVLVPHARLLGGSRPWLVPVSLLTIGAISLAGLSLAGRQGPERPQPNHIQYTLDADTGQATWVSAGTAPDAWTSQFFTEGHVRDAMAFSPGYQFGQEYDVITADAPAVELEAPVATVLDDEMVDGVRRLDVRLHSPRGAPMVHMDLTLPGNLVAVSIDGRPLPVDETAGLRRLPVAAYNPGEAGIDVSFEVRSPDPIRGVLADYSNGLPDLPGITVTERPAQFQPAPFDFRDPTAVTTDITL